MKNLFIAAILGVFCCAADLRADYLLTGSQNGLGASANFSMSGNTLVVTVTNTTAMSAASSNQLLTGFYFSTKGSSPAFSYMSADAPGSDLEVTGSQTSTLQRSSSAATTWEFDKSVTNAPFSMPYGFVSAAVTSICTGSSCGTTTTGKTQPANNFVSGGLPPNTSSVANAPAFGASVIFTLYVPPQTTFSTADISGVAFQFGVAGLTETDFLVLPEPASYFPAIALLLIPAVWFKRRRDQKSRATAEASIL